MIMELGLMLALMSLGNGTDNDCPNDLSLYECVLLKNCISMSEYDPFIRAPYCLEEDCPTTNGTQAYDLLYRDWCSYPEAIPYPD